MPPPPRTPPGERGYAMVAVVAGIAAMAAIAVTLTRYTAATLDTVEAETGHAQLSAATDAGIGMALDGLLRQGPEGGWSIDGSVHRERFGAATLAIRIDDERGKIPLNRLDDEQALHLAEVLGLSGEAAETARDSLLDWIDDDDDPHDHGAEQDWYTPRGITIRNGNLQSVEELGQIRGFTPAMAARLADVATVDGGKAPFDPRTASPLAIRVMSEDVEDSVDELVRQRELGGQRQAIAFSDPDALKGRALTIHVTANGPDHAAASRTALVVLTGAARMPYEIRWVR